MKIFHALIATAALGACDGPSDNRVCTLIGCVGGLRVMLEALPTSSFTLSVQAPGQPAKVVNCPVPASCGTAHVFQDFTASEALIEVTTSLGTARYTVRPEYRVSYPNGSQCEPTCRSATTSVAIPK
jgi:hypothetical protein